MTDTAIQGNANRYCKGQIGKEPEVHYGGLGGHRGGRPADADDLFEMAVERALGARVRESNETAGNLWSALANQDWVHENGDTASYSMRAAGDLVAAIRGSGDYMDWYMRGGYFVSADIALALLSEGWRPTSTDEV